MVLKKEKGTTIVTTVMSVILCSRWFWKGKRYHDCYNSDVCYIVFKMVLKKQKVPRLLQLWCRLYCVQDGSEKENRITIVTTVISVSLCSRWPWKRKKVPRLLQLWCLLYCVEGGPEKGKGTTIVTTVMSVILCSRWPWKRKRYNDCYNCDVCYIVLKMVMKKEKGNWTQYNRHHSCNNRGTFFLFHDHLEHNITDITVVTIVVPFSFFMTILNTI
jgi:hypothetical protein